MQSSVNSHLDYSHPQDPGGGNKPGGGGYAATPISMGSLTDKLRLAASKGQTDKVQELLQAGAGFEPEKDGRTALHYAAQNGYVDTCKLLIEKGCELDAQDAMGYTALLRACSQGQLDVVRVCLEAGCAVDFADEHGNTALHEAAWHGFSKTLELLIRYNADVFRINKSGFSALHLSAQNGHNESSRVLLYGGINSDLQNNYGDTALHTAARYGHAGVTRILISAKCKLNATNKNGDTALHIASALKRRKIAKILVESHIDIHIKNKQNETAADVARRKEHPEIILIITSLSRPHSAGPKTKEAPGVTFKDDIESGPVVCADEEPPIKPEKQEKERGFLAFFKKKKKDKDKDKASLPPSTQAKKSVPPGKVQPLPAKPVAGFFSQYMPRAGTQYYRDLAGNIKQGPVGYTPVCQCGPALHHLEKSMHETKEQLYDHIDASHQVLKDRIEQLDHCTSQQAHSLDRLTRERLEAERRACQNALEERLQRERHHTQYVVESYGDGLQDHIQGWLEDRLASYGHCLDHHHDDSALPPPHIFSDIHLGPDGGRLFRSRSDETLSVSDYSGKGRKRQFYESRKAAMEQIRGWKVPVGNQDSTKQRERGHSTNDLDKRDKRSRDRINYYSGDTRNMGLAASTGNVVTIVDVHKSPDRFMDRASPRFKGEGPTVLSGRMTPSHGATSKQPSHLHSQTGQLYSHLQAQSFQACSHGNLSSQSAKLAAVSSTQPCQNPPSNQPRRGILRSRQDARSISYTRQQPNLDERGPLGKNNFGHKPGDRGGPSIIEPAVTREERTVLPNGNTQSVLDTQHFNTYANVESDSQHGRSRAHSTDAALDAVGAYSGSRFRSRSEEHELESENCVHQPCTPTMGDYSGYVTDSGMRRSYLDPSHHKFGSDRPVTQDRIAGYLSNSNITSDSDKNARFVSGHGSDSTRSVLFQRTHSNTPGYAFQRPVSGERTSTYLTDSDGKQSAQSLSLQSRDLLPSSVQGQCKQQELQPAHQPALRYRVLPPLLPNSLPLGDIMAHPQTTFKPSPQNCSNRSIFDSTQTSSFSVKDSTTNSSVFGRQNNCSGGVTGQNSDQLSGSDVAFPSPDQNGNALSSQQTATVLQEKSHAQRMGSPREQWENSRQLTKEKSAHRSSNILYESLHISNTRTSSPSQMHSSSGRNSVSKSESNLTKVSDSPSPREIMPVSSGHYSVPNGCLRHDSYPYTPVYNVGSKEDSTCSSNQDSGYSSRMVGGLQGQGSGSGGKSAESTTPSSSFSTDRNVSVSTPSNTSSPYMHMGGNSYSDYLPTGGNSAEFQSPRDSSHRTYQQSSKNVPSLYQMPGLRSGQDYPSISPGQQAYSGTTLNSQSAAAGTSIQKQVQGWYQQRLLEAAERLRKTEQYRQADSPSNYTTIPIRYDPVRGSDV